MSQFNLKQAVPLFAAPVFAFQLDEAAALNQQLIEDCLRFRASAPGIVRSNQHGWHSERDFFRRPEPSFRALSRLLLQASAQAMKKLAPKFDLSDMNILAEGWININEKGAFNTPHDHPGFLLSGSYYVKLPSNSSGRSGNIEFLDPRGSNSMSEQERTFFGSTKFQLAPKPGMLLMFPSFLRHWVYPNEDEESRISIAFNVRLIKNNAAAQPKPATMA